MNETQVLDLQSKVKSNPYILENHNKLIDTLRLKRKSNVQELSIARADKLQYFTLSVKEIGEWLEDLNTIEDDDIRIPSILNFYKTIIKDFPVVQYWSKYIEFAWNLYKESDDFIDEEELRSIFSKALNASVYDYRDCRKVWKAILDFFIESFEKTRSEEDFQILLKLQLKSISYPHAKLSESFGQFSKFITKYANEDYEHHMVVASKIYSKAQKQQKYYDEFEISLLKSPDDAFIWSEYLNAVSKYATNIDQLSTVFYRSLMSITTNKDIWISVWIKYIYILYSRENEAVELEQILSKFVRTYSDSSISYAEYIRNCQIFENGYNIFTELRKRMNHLDLMHNNNYDNWKIVALSSISYEFQTFKKYKTKNIEDILFEDIKTFVEFAIQENNDIFHSVEKLSISILGELGNLEQAKSIIESMIDKFNDQCEVWLFYYNFEIKHNSSYDKISALLKTAVDKFAILDWPERIIQEWLHFEQVYGTLDSYKKTLVDSDAKIKLLEIQRMKAAEDNTDKESQKLPVTKEDEKSTNGPNVYEPVRNRENYTIKVSNLDKNTTKDIIKNFFRDCGTPLDIQIIPDEDKLASFVEFNSEKEVFASLTKDKHKLGESRICVKRSLSSIVWVNNYPPSFTQDDVLNLFKKIGGVVNIRFPSQKSKKGRRFCYVEFTNSKLSQKAVMALNGKDFKDMLSNKDYSLKVEISDPSITKGHERSDKNREIIVKNLNFKVTDSPKIQEFFSQCGTIDQITVPLSEQNKSKGYLNNGYAFINFENVASIQRALNLTNRTLDDRRLEIQRVQNHKDNAKTPHEFDDLRSISVLNLGENTTSEQLKYFLVNKVGPINKIEVYPKHEMALVEFSNASDSGKASLLLSNVEFNGRFLEIESKDKFLQKIKGPNNAPSQKRTLMVPTQVKRRKKS